MTPYLAEAGCALRRLARGRAAPAAAAVCVLLAAYAGAVDPVHSARAALSAATAIATLALLIVSSGVVAEDLVRGRLAIAATHPAAPTVWVVGRWLAVWAVAALVFGVTAAPLLAVARGHAGPGGVAAAAVAALVHLGALGALAVALSCVAGPTAQLLLLLGLCAAGAVPPDVIAAPVGGAWALAAARALWTALPTAWALGRVHEWLLAAGAAQPALALVLALQPPLWLSAGARRLADAEFAVRG